MKNKLLLFLCSIAFSFYGQVAGVDTLWKSGPISKRINLVIMGDGYTSAEMTQFLTDANSIYNYMFNTSPFNNYKNYFNVFAIKCQSPNSGVTHPGTATDVTEPASPVMFVGNLFNTRFDNYNIHRLIYSMNSTAVYNILSTHFPNYDQVIILGNSTEYGGAGGSFAVSSVHPSSKEIVMHELGHSFAGLADEYWAGASYAAEKPNMTADNNPSTIKWNPWYGLNGIGAYPYGTASPDNSWFRPHQNCKMRYLNQPFCSVCKEAIIERIHEMISPIEDYSPAISSVVSITSSNSQTFKTTLIQPNPNTLKRDWEINSVKVASNVDSLQVNASLLNFGMNTVTFNVIDTNYLTKDLYHAAFHIFSVVWNVNSNAVGIKEIIPQLEFSVFPNPVSDKLNLKYNLLQDARIGYTITDINGKVVINNKQFRQAKGDYLAQINLADWTNGTYILSIHINEQTISNQFVILK